VSGLNPSGIFGWLASGDAYVLNQRAVTAGGGASGSWPPVAGTSSLTQRFRPPLGVELQLGYYLQCKDRVTRDWADVTLEDETAGTTTTMLHACLDGSSGVTGSSGYLHTPITAGHLYKLTLSNHNDGAGNPSYAKYFNVRIFDAWGQRVSW
jgi:hypothetical protein